MVFSFARPGTVSARRTWPGFVARMVLIGLAASSASGCEAEEARSAGHSLVVWVANNDVKGVAIALNELRNATYRSVQFDVRDPGSYALHYLPDLPSLEALPDEGRNLVALASPQGVLHVRMFDGEGKRVVDTSEAQRSRLGGDFAALRNRLESPSEELSREQQTELIELACTAVGHAPWRLSSQAEVLRLLFQRGDIPDIRLSWARPGQQAPRFTVVFRFLPEQGLIRNWRPLFYRLADRLDAADHAGQTRLPAREVWPWKEPAWFQRMAADLRVPDSPVLILGPDGSDSVPALWFALCEMVRDPAQFPATVTLAATSSLLDYEWEIFETLPDRVDTVEPPSARLDATWGSWTPYYSARNAARPNWYDSLGRMAGLCEDQLKNARPTDRALVERVVREIRKPARSLIQFAASDAMLVDMSYTYLHDVEGIRKIGLLYAEPSDRPGQGPARFLYGPTLRESFQARAADIAADGDQEILPATYPNPSPVPHEPGGKPESWQDPAFLKRLQSSLGPTLKFFRQAGVGAVGVFGGADARLAVLPLVRAELRDVELFTSDATWRLESALTPQTLDDSPRGEGGSRKPAALDGLLVFTTSLPPRPWVESQFVEFSPHSSMDEPFLPDPFQYYTQHVVKRLIELVELGRFDLLNPSKVGQLSTFLRDSTRLGGANSRGTIRPVRIDHPGIDTMIMREGRLGLIADPAQLCLSLGAVLLPLAVLSVQFLQEKKAARLRTREVASTDRVHSPLVFLDRGARQVAALMRGEDGYAVLSSRARWRTANDLLTASLFATTFAFLIGLALAIDGWRELPVSWSLWPDGHSIFPSLYLTALAAVLAHHLPYRFERELGRNGLVRDPRLRPQATESWVLRRWAPPFSPGDLETKFDRSIKEWVDNDVFEALSLTGRKATITALVAFGIVFLELAAGLPVFPGVAYPLLLLGEFLVAWVVLVTACTVYSLSQMPERLQERLVSNTQGLRLAHLDTSSVTRMGSSFIETISYLLVVLALIVVARLPEYNMPHWSRFVWQGIPLGALLCGVALAFILWYWFHCYTTLKALIRAVKMDRLDELETARSNAFRALAEAGQSRDDDVQKVAEELEKQRRSVEVVSEEPWQVSASWRAWFALGVLLLPPILSAMFGSWGELLSRVLRTVTGTL